MTPLAPALTPAFVLLTTKISLVVQILTGFIGLEGLTYALPPPHGVLKQLLLLETVVQFIELTFYAWFVYRFNLGKMAATRYADWVFTTPMMLLTTIVYLKYRGLLYTQQMQKKPYETVVTSIREFVRDHPREIALIFAANWFMLATGYLGEIGVIGIPLATLLGFAGLAVSFTTIYTNFAKTSPTGRALFAFLATFWSAYGIAFVFPAEAKNIVFNILDLFAKNFFGIYLYFQVRRIAAETSAAKEAPENPSESSASATNFEAIAGKETYRDHTIVS